MAAPVNGYVIHVPFRPDDPIQVGPTRPAFFFVSDATGDEVLMISRLCSLFLSLVYLGRKDQLDQKYRFCDPFFREEHDHVFPV